MTLASWMPSPDRPRSATTIGLDERGAMKPPSLRVWKPPGVTYWREVNVAGHDERRWW